MNNFELSDNIKASIQTMDDLKDLAKEISKIKKCTVLLTYKIDDKIITIINTPEKINTKNT
jgi:hypothetical protein